MVHETLSMINKPGCIIEYSICGLSGQTRDVYFMKENTGNEG